MRLAWFAAATFVIIFGVGEFVRWVVVGWGGNDWWGIDLHLLIDAGARLLAGQPIYADERFLYPPLAAVVGVPLVGRSFDLVSVIYALAKILIAAVCVFALARPSSIGVRVFATITLVATLPFLHDVMLGNANVVLVASMVPAIFGSDRRRNGVLLGLTVAIFAKPLVVPVLLWLLVWRRRTLTGTVVAGIIATAFGALVAGPLSYVQWAEALMGGTRYASVFAGNHGVTALVPQLWLPIAAVTSLALVIVLVRRGALVGLVWAATAGLLLAPYAGTYAALPIALAVPGLVAAAPVLALAIVGVSPIATTHPLPVYAALIMLAVLKLPNGVPILEKPAVPNGPDDESTYIAAENHNVVA
jgi:hypothetical protein